VAVRTDATIPLRSFAVHEPANAANRPRLKRKHLSPPRAFRISTRSLNLYQDSQGPAWPFPLPSSHRIRFYSVALAVTFGTTKAKRVSFVALRIAREKRKKEAGEEGVSFFFFSFLAAGQRNKGKMLPYIC
jgi:hypothetical protein